MWYLKGNSEPFETREEAMRRLNTLRRAKKKTHKDGRRFFSEKLNAYFRSNWEIELAELMTELGILWEYEPRRFYFRVECESYLPDYYLPEYNTWIEVKGFMDKRSERRVKLFKKYHGAEYGFFLVMKDELELLRKTPELIYTFIEIAQNERERIERLRR